MTAIITAYCACTICCGPRAAGITASGIRPVEGITISAPRRIPFGTNVRIDGLPNVFIVQDRAAKRYDSRFDIYFRQHSDAVRWGKQKRKITVW